MMDRRSVFEALLAGGALLGAFGASSAQAQNAQARRQPLKMGASQNFSFEQLQKLARDMAGKAYTPPPRPAPEIVQKIDYEAHGKIRYKPEMALFAEGPGAFPVTFFHLGQYFQKSVRMHVVEGDRAREILYDPDLFDMPADSLARKLPANAGFAGFRFQENRNNQTIGRDGKPLDWQKNDWVAFLGASYFRAIGDLFQYGLSARGIAIDPAVQDAPEEFPDFTHIFIETPRDGTDSVTVYALLDGPSIAGAYRFIMRREKNVTMEIEKHLTLRKAVKRLGIAPLTSMYWYSETQKPTAIDWRPEVHDSDGLQILGAHGERLWRPLHNPSRTMVSSFVDQNVRGFGLMQRDRAVANYLDGVAYERRPSLWVEPVGDWGLGQVQLIEIPTDDEIHDNIVAMWTPNTPPKAGETMKFAYRLYWQSDAPDLGPLARCVATRLGNGGQPGNPRPKGVRKFMVEFLGGPLDSIPFGERPEAVLWASRGTFSYIFTEAVPDDVKGHWRAQFDLTVDGPEPVEMSLHLVHNKQALTETWLYQYHPF